MEAFSLTFNNSGNSLSKLTTNDIFEILSLSWFQNYPWMLDLVKKWLRYWWLKRRLQFPNRPSLSIQVAAARAPRGEVYLGWASLPRHSATEFLLVGPMHKRRETYQNRRASPLCFGNFFLSGKVLYQCALYWPINSLLLYSRVFGFTKTRPVSWNGIYISKSRL